VTRILTVPSEEAQGLRKLMVWQTRRQYGGVVPGIFEVLMPDLQVALPTGWLYNHLHMRKSSPLTRLQREMLATVVNGIVGGAP
jgi:hypothetical protein